MAVNMELELRRAERDKATLLQLLRALWQQIGPGEKMIFLTAHPEYINLIEEIDGS